jgi:hypothetical protein
MLRRLFILSAVWAGIGLAGAAADPVFPPGQRIGLEPPPGMNVSQHFAGFEDAANKATISVIEVPLPAYERIEKSIFDNVPPAFDMDRREMLPFANGVGFLLSGKIDVDGTMMHRWYLLGRAIAGSSTDFAAFVTVNVPESALSLYPDKAVRAALSSVTLRPPPLAEQLGMLPFTLTEFAGFRVMQAMPSGGVIITDGPTNDMNNQPYMIISVGPGAPAAAGDRGRVAQELLASAPLADLNITLAEAMRLSNLPGYEIRANARNIRGEPIKLVQWIRFGASGYMRIIGVVGADRWDQYFPRFRAVRDGVELR